MIATMKVLGLRAGAPGAVAAAAFRVVRYVEGGAHQPGDDQRPGAGDKPAGLADYYEPDTDTDTAGDADGDVSAGEETRARGEARGSAAELVGLRGRVSGAQLRLLLAGRHAVTGHPLLAAGGSAGRARHAAPDVPADREMLTLAEAAQLAG